MKTVRDGQKVWPYCSECGCRLKVDNWTSIYFYFVYHFWDSFNATDYRGHGCSYKVYKYNRQEYPHLEEYGNLSFSIN